MTMEDVLKLVNAGYTKEEIAQMTDPEPPKDPELEKRLSGIETVMNTLLKAVQANNLQNDSLNNPPADSLEKQTDDIMASIIRPTIEKRKDDK